MAARHGVTSLAVSSGESASHALSYDFTAAAKYAIDWLRGARAAETSHLGQKATLVSLNVPSCNGGSVRGELKTARQLTFAKGESVLGTQDSTSTARPSAEVAAFTDGFATLVPLPLSPG